MVAQESLTSCIQRQPDYEWLYVWRGLASSQLAAIARDQLTKQASPKGQSSSEEADRHFEAAQADYDRALKLLEPKPNALARWVVLFNRGLLFVQHEDWQKASADFEAATRLDERRPEAFAGLGLVCRRQHQLDQAVEQFTRAIARKPGSAPLYRGRAEADLARRSLTPAERARALLDLEQAIRLEAPANPVRALDHTRRATLLHQEHREAEALAACEAALKVDPDHRDAHHLRIQVLLDMQHYDDVVRSCDSLLAHDKTSAVLHELRGLARTGLGDKAGAIEDYTQAIALRPGRGVLLVRRGGLYLVSDAPKLALHDFEEAVRLDPRDSDALSGRAAARVRLGQHREAVADAERALAMGAATEHRLYSAARIYARAAAVAATEVRKNVQETVRLVARYQDQSTTLLRKAINELPASERAAFWRSEVESDPDPAMSTIRRRLRSGEMAGASRQ
jgi:tetratricopeptide (TPR) repeat protein